MAFYTTLPALLPSAVLMFAMHIMQEREEGALNRIGQYCLRYRATIADNPRRGLGNSNRKGNST